MNNYNNKPLEKLVVLAKNGDKFALGEIVKRYKNKIYNEFLSFHSDFNLSDMTQDTFLKITKSVKNLKNPEKFDIWLRRIIKNIISDYGRKLAKNKSYTTNPIKESSLEFGECVIDDDKTPDENALACELKMEINSAISTLSPLLKTIIILREIDGLSYEEIAKLAGISIGTVKSRLARARIKLRKKLEPYMSGE